MPTEVHKKCTVVTQNRNVRAFKYLGHPQKLRFSSILPQRYIHLGPLI